MNPTKFFTPKEATQTLPLVRKIVTDILKLGEEMRALYNKLGSNAEEHPEVLRLADLLEDLFRELEGLGCFYKDWNFSMGLVDFPAVIDGKEVFLCWRSDEPALRYYHGVEEGFTGRQLIPEELLN